jgi:hypothetical protein
MTKNYQFWAVPNLCPSKRFSLTLMFVEIGIMMFWTFNVGSFGEETGRREGE